MHEKRWLGCYIRLFNIVNLKKNSTLGHYNSKTGGHTTKNFLLNLLKMVKNNLVQTFFYLIFLLPVTTFCPLAKNWLDPKILPNFFFSLNPPLSDFKVKFRGHPFAYTLTNTATGLIWKFRWRQNGEHFCIFDLIFRFLRTFYIRITCY